MNKKINIVMVSVGEYSDRVEYVYKAFYNIDNAMECADQLSEENRLIMQLPQESRMEQYNKMFPNIDHYDLKYEGATLFIYGDVDIGDEQ